MFLALALLLSTVSVTAIDAIDASPAAAASGCGTASKTGSYGVSIFGRWYKTVTQTGRIRACKDSTKITTNASQGHECNKHGWYTIANSITKSQSISRTGGPEAPNVFECNFHGGAQIKGVGVGVTRDLFVSVNPYVRRASDTVPWVRKSSWTRCC